MNLDRKQIAELALANGFKLKQQPDGSMALNPYVFDFAGALMVAWAVTHVMPFLAPALLGAQP